METTGKYYNLILHVHDYYTCVCVCMWLLIYMYIFINFYSLVYQTLSLGDIGILPQCGV